MAAVQLKNIKALRMLLDRSQSEMADLMGVSLRALQSYEQGWRQVPWYVQQRAAIALFLTGRNNRSRSNPCWKTRKCEAGVRNQCAAYKLRAGDMCWLLTNTRRENQGACWDKKMERCVKCPVMLEWLPAQVPQGRNAVKSKPSAARRPQGH